MTYSFQNQPRCPDRIAVLDLESLAPPAPDGTSFPPWPTHQPVVASILLGTVRRYGQWDFELESVTFEDGKAAIQRVSQLIERRSLITFGGKNFDVLVLAKTAMQHRVVDAAGIARAWRAHRFSDDHIDLAEVITNFGGGGRGASLDALCKALGIPAKLGAHGSQVSEMMANGDLESVINYCTQDVLGTAYLAAMVLGLRRNEPGYAGSLISQLGRWIFDKGLEHLRPFERIDGHGELESLSLLHMLEEGIASLEHRTHMRFVTGKPGDAESLSPGHSDFPA